MTFETDIWPFIPAKYAKHVEPPRSVRVIVIHSTESLEVEGGARAIAHYFQNPPRPGSSHVVCDDKETIQCVRDSDIAAGAIGVNRDGIHIEQVGKAGQTDAEWNDKYSAMVVSRTADVAAQYCLKYSIPVVHLTNAELKAGAKGIIGHYQASQVYPGTGHSDPGSSYPWDLFISQVQAAYDERLIEQKEKSGVK